MTGPDRDFYSPEMFEAERELDAQINRSMDLVRQSENLLADMAKEDQGQLTEEDIDRLRAYVTGHARTPEWERVIARIEAGELTWAQVADDPLGRADPDVGAAFRSLSQVPPLSEAEIVELYGGTPAPEAEPVPRGRPDRLDEDSDEWFSELGWLRR
jgi:hypothetical protein